MSTQVIGEISSAHYAQILKINVHFVHWLAPLDMDELQYILSKASYARQIDDGQGVLIGYGHDAPYLEHENMNWLSKKFDKFFYIDRVIIDEKAIGQGLGRMLYEDLENYARAAGYPRLRRTSLQSGCKIRPLLRETIIAFLSFPLPAVKKYVISVKDTCKS